MIAELLKSKYKVWKDNRTLKQSGFKTWPDYYRFHDPDYNISATRITDYYHGYPFVCCFENHKHVIYQWDLGFDGSRAIVEWCEDNCRDKFRFDGLRAMKEPSTAWEWHINEFGGGDYYFAAFKNESDYINFVLKWL